MVNHITGALIRKTGQYAGKRNHLRQVDLALVTHESLDVAHRCTRCIRPDEGLAPIEIITSEAVYKTPDWL